MDKLMSDLKAQIIAQLNLQDIKPEDIGDDQPLFVDGRGRRVDTTRQDIVQQFVQPELGPMNILMFR